MSEPRPSLTMLRDLTDGQVLRALFEVRRSTRAELAQRTGISKPTIAASIRRLVAAGLVVDTGARTTGRGAVGSYFALATDVGVGLAVSIEPGGLKGELVDVPGNVLERAESALRRPVQSGRLTAGLQRIAQRLQATASGPVRVVVVSASDPVDRATGRLVRLPSAPFLLGALDPQAALASVVDGPVVVDNDVNWAARAERRSVAGEPLDDFAYLYLGEGLGGAVVSDGEVRRGRGGFIGEIADVVTVGADGRACSFLDVFAQLGLRRRGSTVIDVAALTAAVEGPRSRVLRVIAEAVGGVLRAVVALADPQVVVLGGPWGSLPRVVEAISSAAAALPRAVPVRAAAVTDDAPLAGARVHAVEALRAAVLHRATG